MISSNIWRPTTMEKGGGWSVFLTGQSNVTKLEGGQILAAKRKRESCSRIRIWRVRRLEGHGARAEKSGADLGAAR